jgi:bacillithiol biosynthesis cysteine-adding enzyme BshC
MVEPHALRELMVPVFDRLIRWPTECTHLLNDAGAQLDELGYSPRIHKKSNICNFFLLNDEGKRLRVTYNGEFQIANETLSQRDLLHLLADEPVRFSANALTRPITQDFLFPTFAYVAGPNEIAYLAQLPAIYEFFSLEMPVIFPRFGATILESKIVQVLEKYHVETQELRNLEKLLKELAREKINGPFNAFRSEVSQRMDTVIQQVKAIDATLTAPGALAKGRILKTIDVLEDKVASKLKEQDLVARHQLTKASNNLFPTGHLQERQINVLEYLIKFGTEFLQRVYADFREAEYGAHQVITC